MRAPANWPRGVAPALAWLALYTGAAHASRSASETPATAAPAATEVCEYRTINYITHTLPQQCLRTSWTSPTPTATDNSTVQPTITTTQAATNTVPETPGAAQDNGTAQEQDGQEELAASSFMSFEEWKEMMLRKSGQDPANIKAQKQREHRERDPSMNADDVDSFGEEGEIALDFDALTDKVSEITSSPTGAAGPNSNQEVKEEHILSDDGKTQYYRSKDAGKTCKERFSYASFDAGATVLKTSPGAKNAKAILVENKDSYMLLECRAKNKFVIVELSDDILVDTVVLANFEFFSSMIRKFTVSVSDRYPVKLDKWVDLGTFEARNSRDIQAFLIEHPQIYTKYIRIEFLSHWGNEFYCPVSLLRVHGTRMLDSWKEPSHDDEPEQIEAEAHEPVEETQQVQKPTAVDTSSVVSKEEAMPSHIAEMGLTPWHPLLQSNLFHEMCEVRSPTTADPTPVESASSNSLKKLPAAPESVTPRPSAASRADKGSPPNDSSSSQPPSPQSSVSQGKSTSTASTTTPSTPPHAGNNSTTNHVSQKQTDGRTDGADNSSATTTTQRNKTSSVASSASASPTVQESFFKTVTKRLQLLESNTSLSLQYIEDQSRFLQEVLLKMERKQITRVDSFLDNLNKTVLSELRNVRTQYDQIWQSTVIALETQREQSQREIVALTSRLNILADEVVFQKRMAILQSVLLLACLVLVIFSRGGLAALDSASFPAFPPASSNSIYRRYGYNPYNGNGNGGPARSDSISGLSMPGSSSPPDPTTTTTIIRPAAADSAAISINRHNLAASALPRHLYQSQSPSSSPSSSYRNKTLPLTPPSEYLSREGTPATPLARSPESSFYEEQPPQHRPQEDDEEDEEEEEEEEGDDERSQQTFPSTAPAAAATTTAATTAADVDDISIPIETEISTETSTELELDPRPGADDLSHIDATTIIADENREVLEKTKTKKKKKPPLNGRARSAMAQLGAGGVNGLRKPLPALPEDSSGGL